MRYDRRYRYDDDRYYRSRFTLNLKTIAIAVPVFLVAFFVRVGGRSTWLAPVLTLTACGITAVVIAVVCVLVWRDRHR